MKTIIEDHGLPLIQIGRVSRDEDLADWPTVSTTDFKATFWLLVAAALFVAICAVTQPPVPS